MESNIAISGGSILQRKIVSQAAKFYLKKLLPKNYFEVTLVIKLKKNYYERSGSRADMIPDDDQDSDDYPREFELQLDSSMKMCGLLRALAHECVHVKQYVLYEMEDTSNIHIVCWNKKKYDTRKINYFDLPWEIDAYGREIGLHSIFIERFKYLKAKWNQYDPDY